MNFFIEENMLQNGSESIFLEDDQVHHFRNVQRGKEGDKAKAFDGRGNVYQVVVAQSKKKTLLLKVESHQHIKRNYGELKLILGTPKKEYVESIFRSATQIGLNEIALVPTKFSPYKFKMSERYLKILKSSVVQSENPWMPEIITYNGIQDLNNIEGNIVVFSTEREGTPTSDLGDVSHFFIGPEGGFHGDELDTLSHLKNVCFCRCNTPIMKAEVAVPYCASFVRNLVALPK